MRIAKVFFHVRGKHQQIEMYNIMFETWNRHPQVVLLDTLQLYTLSPYTKNDPDTNHTAYVC